MIKHHSGIEITRLSVKKMDTGTNMVGCVEVVFNNSFVIKRIKLIKNWKTNSIMVIMPDYFDSRQKKHMSICNPITNEFRSFLEKIILERFNNNENDATAISSQNQNNLS